MQREKKRNRSKEKKSQATAQKGVRWNVCQISTGRHMQKKRNKTTNKKVFLLLFHNAVGCGAYIAE
jgi:hypothetical protein